MKRNLVWTQRMLWSRWNQRVAKQSLSSASFGGAIIERRISFVMNKPASHIRNQSSMLPPTSGLLESVSKYMFSPSFAENDDDTKDARELMDELLDSSIAVGEMNASHLKNTKRAFALLADMKQTTKEDIDKAWNLLDRLTEELKHPTSNVTLPPEEQTALLNRVLRTWRNSVGHRTYIRLEKRDAIEECNRLLSRFDRDSLFFQPNTGSYNDVLNGLNRFKTSKGGRGQAIQLQVAKTIEAILERMKKEAEINPAVKPDKNTYTSLIHAHKGSKSFDAYESAKDILDRMKRDGMNPDISSYNAVLGVLLRTKQHAGEKAEEFLYRIEEDNIKPNDKSFAYVIEAWARQENSASAQRAEDIVKHMHKQHDEGVTDINPGFTCYKWAILAWTKSGDPAAFQKADAILRQAQQRNIQSNPEFFSLIMAACAQSADPNAAVKADALLQEMKSLGFKPDKGNYICVLKAWKMSKDPQAKTRIEMLTKEMETKGFI